MSETDKIIANVNATMSMEGMPLSSEDKERIRLCVDGKKSFDTAVNELVRQFRKKEASL